MNIDKMKIIIICMFAVIVSTASNIFLTYSKNSNHSHKEEHHEDRHEEKKIIELTSKQIKKFDIQTITLTKTNFQHRLTFPGQIGLNENTITHVVSSVSGTVKEIFKSLGEIVQSGEALATIQSREMAEAKSIYISAYKNINLQKDLLVRDEKLWKLKVKPEVQIIQMRNTYENAKITLEHTRQKLLALGMTKEQIDKLSDQNGPLNIYTIDSPIAGKIIERHITRGEVISNDKQLFVVANLDTVWVNLAIPAEELPKIKNDQKVDIFAHKGELICSGKIMYVSPVINDESRTGRAIIQLANSKHLLHPGDFIKAQVFVSDNSALLSLPSTALQRIDGKTVIFTRTKDNNFEAIPVNIKGSDKGEFIEILDGVKEGDNVVIKNCFFLKAELEKSEAEHSH